MAVSCTPSYLTTAAKCFACLTPKQQRDVTTYLLAVIAGGSLDPKVLAKQAACMACLTPKQAADVQNYLLCAILNK